MTKKQLGRLDVLQETVCMMVWCHLLRTENSTKNLQQYHDDAKVVMAEMRKDLLQTPKLTPQQFADTYGVTVTVDKSMLAELWDRSWEIKPNSSGTDPSMDIWFKQGDQWSDAVEIYPDALDLSDIPDDWTERIWRPRG